MNLAFNWDQGYLAIIPEIKKLPILIGLITLCKLRR